MEAAVSPPEPVEDAKSLDKLHSLPLEAGSAKDCRKGVKGKSTMERSSTKSRAPRITIKLVAKKKIKSVKEPPKKSVRKLKLKGDEDQPEVKDIQEDGLSDAHVKLKTEPCDDKHGSEDKGVGSLPTRRRGRSASKTSEPVCQTGTKVEIDDQKSKERKSLNKLDTVKESGTTEPKANAKKLKQKENAVEQCSEANQPVIRRSNRVTNPPSKGASHSAGDPEDLCSNDTIMAESKSEVPRILETKPKSDRRRQSKRLNKDAAVPENTGQSLTATDNLTVQPSDCLRNEEMRVPSLKLKRIKNPKYVAQATGKNSTRKKKRRKFVWTLTLVKAASQTCSVEKTVTISEKPVSEVDPSTLCDTSVSKTLKEVDKRIKMDNTTPEEIRSTEKFSQDKADKILEEKSALEVEIEVEHITETLQEIAKTDGGKVPPLQIKKVSSPGKHNSSKPSFLIQQVSPVPEKKEEVLKDPSEVKEDSSLSMDAEVTPVRRRLRKRMSILDSPQRKSLSHKPLTTQKQRLKSSLQDKITPHIEVENSSQVSTEDSSSQVLPENSCQVLAEEMPQVTSGNSSEVPDKDSSNTADDLSQVPCEISPQKLDTELQPQIKEAKPLPVPSKPRRSRNNTFVKKKSAQRKKSVLSKTVTNTELATVEVPNTEVLLKEDAQPLVTEERTPETKDCTQPEANQDNMPVEEEQILPPVKEETDIQLIDSQQSLVSESQGNEPETACLENISLKKCKKRRKSLIGQRPKHRHRGRDGKFAPIKLPENQKIVEEDISTPLAFNTPSPSSKLIGIHKKYKKTKTGIQFISSKRPKPPSKTLSKLIDLGLDKDSLKQEETDTLVDGAQATVVESHPGKSKFVKNIKHFIMPVVSARSSRVIKTPQRFMDDAGMSVLPRRNSPKKGFQLGFPIRPGKRRDDEADRAISPILPVDEEDILSEAQLDVDLFSVQDLDDDLDIADSLFSERKSDKNEAKSSLLRNSNFKWHMPDESEDVYTLDTSAENKCEDRFFSTPAEQTTEQSADLLEGQKKKSSHKLNKQMAHLKIFQRLKKTQTGLPKSKMTPEGDNLSKPLQTPVDLAEGLDDEAMSISLRQRNTNTEKEKSKLKIEDLNAPGVVRKVSVCVRNSKSLVLQPSKEGDLAEKATDQLHPGEHHNIKSFR